MSNALHLLMLLLLNASNRKLYSGFCFLHDYHADRIMLVHKNEMNRALGHLCAHIGYTGPGEPPEDGEMIEMTLSWQYIGAYMYMYVH